MTTDHRFGDRLAAVIMLAGAALGPASAGPCRAETARPALAAPSHGAATHSVGRAQNDDDPSLVEITVPVELGAARTPDREMKPELPVPLLEARVNDVVREFLFGAASFDQEDARRELLGDIARWLAVNFDLPDAGELPRVARATPEKLAALRYGPLLKSGRDPGAPISSAQASTVAVYIDVEHTIYLAEGWSGRTLAELSVLVHEMVHHLQSKGRLKHACPNAREKLAYSAQQQWLKVFGRDLEGEFGLDGFSLLVKTSCAY
jgi:hypothetical protein